ncbi:MAG TPA: hypothetical protein VGB57_01765 [Allosphingosinicella sp.]|jgi:hypothetical protein
MTLFGFGILYGVDNAAVALVLAPLLGWRRGLALAALFGLAEALMPLAGLALAWPPAVAAESAVRAGILALAATSLAGLLLVRRDPAAAIRSPGAMVALALLLSLDNVVAGGEAGSVAGAAAIGLASASLAAMGCALGALLGARLSPSAAAVGSTGGLVVLALANAVS